ncbi:MAG: ATP-binding protein [Stellaceae bacterium]
MERNGYPEETYYTFSYSPILTEDGTVGGIICANTDDTHRVIGERQLALLRELATDTAEARSWQQACERAASALSTNRRDLPFAMIYMADPDGGTVSLAGLSGIEPGHPAAPVSFALEAASPWPIGAVLEQHAPQFVSDLARAFPGDIPTGAWGQPPARAVVLPIPATGETGRTGALIAGLNPFRLFDRSYSGFLDLVVGQIAAALTNADAYEAERRRAEALAEIDRAKTTFFSNVSHEFRTPLTLMLGPLEELLANQARSGGNSDRDLIETAHRNGLRLLKLVNSLLDFSRIEAGRVQARYQPTDLAALTAEVASTFRSAVGQAGLRLTINCLPLAEPVSVDPDMWEKIVLNLISNAFKFTFEGEIGVSIGTSADGAAAELTVRDTGTGIPAHELPHLFERFHRIEGAKGRTFEGSGIGLALVQELVRLHGGAIGVDSEPGRGTVFTIIVPFGSAHLPSERIGDARRGPARIRAQAYVEEALSWLPRDKGGDAADPALTRSILDDFDAPAPPAAPGRVLLADDNADMRDYVCRLLADQHYAVEAVADGEAALAKIRGHAPDLVLTGVMMPGLDGFGLLRALRADPTTRDIPVLLLSARAGEEARVEGIDIGANDYLTKPFSARELLARVSTNLQMARVRREAMEALRARTVELETVLATVPAGVWFTHDRNARRITSNLQAAALLRLAPEEVASLGSRNGNGPKIGVFNSEGVEIKRRDLPLPRAARGEEIRDEELELRFANGDTTTLLVQATPLRDRADAGVKGAIAAAVDITRRKLAEQSLRRVNENLDERVAEEIERRRQAESELRQAQKIEAIGQLTGGVAHDMNNLLLVIQGSLEWLERQALPGDSGTARAMQMAQRGVSRASALTSQLLAFARRQPLDPRPVEPNRLVAAMSDLLRRTLGESIAIETVLAGGLWRTFADPNQVENAILNLAVNARDAMPQGGKLTIETANSYLDDGYAAAHHEVVAGQYVMIAISDTGIGMSKEAVEKAFEPFFTTKEPGRGTGLGLSQVYGFAKQSGGHVKIYSEPGQGTTVKMYLPRHTGDEAPAAEPAPAAIPSAQDAETILVVEDDDDVRANSVASLRELGYRVVEAADAAGAMRRLERDPSIRLLFTDVGLPGGQNGRQLTDAAREYRPDLKVLFTTGYARNAIVHHGRLDPGVELIVKPYTYAALAEKIRAVLVAGSS